jgi:ribonucleoside-diphosphate reductase alpha chain
MLIIEECIELEDVYDITVKNNHNFFANDILVHNCQEISIPSNGYDSVKELYEIPEYDVANSPEVGLCSLAGIVISNVKDDKEYAKAAYYSLLMIHTAIHESEHEFPQVAYTAKARNSAGVGILGLAHYMAKNKLSFMSQEGRNEIHKVAERHYYHLVNASLELSKEFGVAKWMNKTKWPEGWLPLDTYNKNIDSIVTIDYQYDWEELRQKIIANGGIHNSVLVAHAPSESSSLASGTTNGVYPIRMLNMLKTNDSDVLTYSVPDSEKLEKYYELAYNIPTINMKQVYGILQKYTDQAISADDWKSVRGDTKIESTELLQDFFDSLKYGNKTRYYINFETSKAIDLNATENMENDVVINEDSEDEYCESCTL